MAETRVDQLSDFTHFLEFHGEGSSQPSPVPNRSSYLNSSSSPVHVQNPDAHAQAEQGKPSQKDSSFQNVLHSPQMEAKNISQEELMKHLEEIAQKEGVSTQKVMEDLTKRNTATKTYHNFLLTDLMVKGSFLIFNFWIVMLEAQKKLIKDDKKEE